MMIDTAGNNSKLRTDMIAEKVKTTQTVKVYIGYWNIDDICCSSQTKRRTVLKYTRKINYLVLRILFFKITLGREN